MLPVGWTNAASAARAAAACLKTADLPRDEHSPVLPWSVPRLTLLHQRWLRDWRVHSIRSAALEGIVVGHPALRDGPVRTSTLFYCDKELTFARTLSRYYRLGRPAGEGET
jgi:hypothetical protein